MEYRFKRLTFLSFCDLCVAMSLFLGLVCGLIAFLASLVGFDPPGFNLPGFTRQPSMWNAIGMLIMAPVAMSIMGLIAGIVLYVPFNFYLRFSSIRMNDGIDDAPSEARPRTPHYLRKAGIATWLIAAVALCAIECSQIPRYRAEVAAMQEISRITDQPICYQRREGLPGTGYVTYLWIPKAELSEEDVSALIEALRNFPRLRFLVVTEVSSPPTATSKLRSEFSKVYVSDSASTFLTAAGVRSIYYRNLSSP